MPVFGHVTPYLGALPLPDDREAMKHFLDEIAKKIEQDKCVMIYPEAHIWPNYTKIRPFTDSSFRYPVQLKSPVMCFTNTYLLHIVTKYFILRHYPVRAHTRIEPSKPVVIHL